MRTREVRNEQYLQGASLNILDKKSFDDCKIDIFQLQANWQRFVQFEMKTSDNSMKDLMQQQHVHIAPSSLHILPLQCLFPNLVNGLIEMYSDRNRRYAAIENLLYKCIKERFIPRKGLKSI